MKMTLLELTQNILSAMSSDEVNSINDTVEAAQVAEIIKETYMLMIANQDRPEHYQLMQLEALADSTKPNYLKLPEAIESVDDLRYNIQRSTDIDPMWIDIIYKMPHEFIKLTQSRKPSDGNVETVTDFNAVPLYILNDRNPSYWTSFDDTYAVFDAYDSSVDSTLQASKSACLARITPTFEMTDDFVPNISTHMFPMLLAEAKSTCFVNIKGVANAKVEKQARQQKVSMQNDRNRFRPDIRSSYPNYGRRRPG